MPGPARDITEVLAACLDDLAAGFTPAQCLEHYPEYAEDLQPLLLIADRLEARWPAMSSGAKARGRERIHRALDERPARLFGWLPLWEQAVALVLIIVSLAAAWLAWPGHKWRTLTPAAVPTASATPSPEPTAALPTASSLPVVAIPTHTPTATSAAPRTATPAWVPTLTVERAGPSAMSLATQTTVVVSVTPVSAPVNKAAPRAERPEPTTAPQETTAPRPTSAQQPTVAPYPQATPPNDEKQLPPKARPRATAKPEHRTEKPAMPVPPTAEPPPTRAAEHPTQQPQATKEPDRHEQKQAPLGPETRPTKDGDEHHGGSEPEANRENHKLSGEHNQSRK